MGTSIDEFSPQFQSAIQGLMAACPGLTIKSGFRSYEDQARLYAMYQNGTGNLAAPPGQSNHENPATGAVDLGGDLECAASKMAEFGLHTPVDGEPWHFELIDPNAEGTTDETEDPAAPEEDDLSGIRDMIYGGGDGQDIVARVAEGFAPKEKPAPAEAATEFVPQASAGFDEGGGGTISATEAARYLAGAGFTGDALVTAVAVAMGESGLNTGAMGDTTITGNGWGPSVGLMQIRSRTSGDEANGWRDGSQLTDPSFNAKAAFAISNGGTNFGPWTVYSKGIYKQFVGEAKAAVMALGSDAYQPAAAPEAASVDPQDDLGPADAVFDPAALASDIADMLLANQGEAGDIVDKIQAKEVEDPTTGPEAGMGVTF